MSKALSEDAQYCEAVKCFEKEDYKTARTVLAPLTSVLSSETSLTKETWAHANLMMGLIYLHGWGGTQASREDASDYFVESGNNGNQIAIQKMIEYHKYYVDNPGEHPDGEDSKLSEESMQTWVKALKK